MISVIICTHNPRKDYLRRVFAGLASQTLPMAEWELLLVDNASKEPLSKLWDISWHRNARHVREEKPGLTHARLRGIRESQGDLLIFVDDDNVLSDNYLSAATDIAKRYPDIGAFGGSAKGEFEAPLPGWMKPYLGHIAVWELERDYWSNLTLWSPAVPFGAGLCIRRVVADDYERKTQANSLRTLLDRTSGGLGTGGDTDLALCAIDLKMGTGRFQALRLTHLIASGRLTEAYITRLVAGGAASVVILKSVRGEVQENKTQALVLLMLRMFRRSSLERRLLLTAHLARKRALDFLSGRRDSLDF